MNSTCWRPIVSLLYMALLGLQACSHTPIVVETSAYSAEEYIENVNREIRDDRGRFREISCSILQSHGRSLPHHRDCDEVLVRIDREPEGSGKPVDLGVSSRQLMLALVPGLGWECFEDWLGYESNFSNYLESIGYSGMLFDVDGLSGTETNARQVRDQVLALGEDIPPQSLVLVGYSKGAADVLTAVVNHPEILPHLAAVVSVAGTIGGSPLANESNQDQVELLEHFPDSDCTRGDGKGLESLRPDFRKAWLGTTVLPDSVPYYSVVTYPSRDQISNALEPTYEKLAEIDPRNDGQVIFYDQLVPGSTLLAYLNADHWAVWVPIAENKPIIGRFLADKNDFPRQAMAEALIRYIDEDLNNRPSPKKNRATP